MTKSIAVALSSSQLTNFRSTYRLRNSAFCDISCAKNQNKNFSNWKEFLFFFFRLFYWWLATLEWVGSRSIGLWWFFFLMCRNIFCDWASVRWTGHSCWPFPCRKRSCSSWWPSSRSWSIGRWISANRGCSPFSARRATISRSDIRSVSSLTQHLLSCV